MEGAAEALRSRSRSKTPFLRSSCDREICGEGEGAEHRHASGRRTPVKKSTTVKQGRGSAERSAPAPIVEEPEEPVVYTSPPAHRTRHAVRTSTAVKTSDYSSEESPDRIRTATSTEQLQNKLNSHYEYERVSTTSSSQRVYAGGASLTDLSLSPVPQSPDHSYHVTSHRSQYSPAHSACSTDSSFAEQALADVSRAIEQDSSLEHLPYRIYKMAGEYWNKYPKTDYTYSPLSKDRVELAPGQVAVPNMSRRSLSQFRLHGPATSTDELDRLLLQHNTAWQTSTVRRRYNYEEESEDEATHAVNGGHARAGVPQRWLLTQWLLAVYTTVTTTLTETYGRIRGREHRYPYTERRQPSRGVLRSAGSLLAAPLVWIYSAFRQVITTTTTTITETITSKDANNYGSYSSQSDQYRAQGYAAKKRRVWPWLLLLLLPLIGYGCYSNQEILAATETKFNPVDDYVSPIIVQDPDLARRLSVLENWVGAVDSRLKYFDQKLSKIDNMEAQIESYSLKHLQQNLIQIFNINGKDGKLTSDELKTWFDKHYVSKDEIESMGKEIHEKLTEVKPNVDEDSIRKIVQEYLAVFEKRQLEVLMVRFEQYVREVREVRVEAGGGLDAEAVRNIVAGMLKVYDADKTGIVDYALESAGGQVISTKCTELYQIKTKQYSILGMPVWWVYTSPRFALTPGAVPAECWAFQGFPGYLVLRTYAIIEVTGFSVEHMSKLLSADGKIESAPKNFSVYGLREEFDPEPHLFGDYMYDENGTSIQHFPVQHANTVEIGGTAYPVAYDTVELRVQSNYGNPTYTCVYRFRVHGNPLSDIRRATEDSMKDGS